MVHSMLKTACLVEWGIFYSNLGWTLQKKSFIKMRRKVEGMVMINVSFHPRD